MRYVLSVLLALLISLNTFNANAFSGKNQSSALTANIFKCLSANYKFNERDFRGALVLYNEMLAKKPDNAKLLYKTGICYLNLKMKKEAITNLEKAFKLNNKVDKDIHFTLGRAYHLNTELEKALAEFETYLKSASEKRIKRNDVNKHIEQVKFAMEQIKNPLKVKIENMGDAVNSKYPDYAPSLNKEETVLIFTSRRENTTGGGKDPYDFQYFEDVYISTRNSTAGEWSKPQQISPLINTEYHDASLSISPDGQTIYLYKNDNKNGGDIYESRQGADKSWLIPKPLPNTVNTDYFESSASVTEDGKTLYFASERLGGRGSGDIYKSVKNANGEWGAPENLGDVINTSEDEISSYISPDGKTLYFSSKGHKGMGGYDIYKSVVENGEWSKPVNLGYPINSTDDDLHFVQSKDGERAYFSTIRDDSKGDRDLYWIDFLKETKKEEVATTAPEPEAPATKVLVKNVKGKITDNMLNGIASNIVFTDVNTGEQLATVNSNDQGDFSLPLAGGKKYKVTVSSNGYKEVSETIEVPKDSLNNTWTMDAKFRLSKEKTAVKNPEVKEHFSTSHTIYFASGSSKLVLNKETRSTLNQLLSHLKQDKQLKVELTGYSDNTGTERLNKTLSAKRAQSIADYFAKKGISKKRIKLQGLGTENPAADNDSEEGRKMNRRVEINVQ